MKKILTVFIVLMTGWILAQDMKSFNISMKNENMGSIKNKFSFLCHIEEFNKIVGIDDPVTKKAIKATGDILNSMQKGDVKRLEMLSYSQKEMGFFNGILPIYQNMYNNESVEFVAQLKLENKQFIFYRTFMKNDNTKTPIYLFCLLCEKDNNFVYMFPNEIETMIAEIACGSLCNGINTNKQNTEKVETQQKIRISHDGTSGNDCYWLFTGIPVHNVDVSMYDAQHKHDNNIVHEILTFFNSSLNDIRTKFTNDYVQLYYTRKSAKTFSNSLSKMQKGRA